MSVYHGLGINLQELCLFSQECHEVGISVIVPITDEETEAGKIKSLAYLNEVVS